MKHIIIVYQPIDVRNSGGQTRLNTFRPEKDNSFPFLSVTRFAAESGDYLLHYITYAEDIAEGARALNTGTMTAIKNQIEQYESKVINAKDERLLLFHTGNKERLSFPNIHPTRDNIRCCGVFAGNNIEVVRNVISLGGGFLVEKEITLDKALYEIWDDYFVKPANLA